jgi:hypothetical protein
MASRKVALSAAFLALAAGGTAACDASPDDDFDDSAYASDGGGYSSGYDAADSGFSGDDSTDSSDSDSGDDSDSDDGTGDEVFYCADEDGEIVDEDNCDDDSGSSSYFLWHSTGYSRGLRTGTMLDGGDYFPAGDRATRRAFKLPATGKVGNGTVKTNVVGRGSSGGSGVSTGTSGG